MIPPDPFHQIGDLLRSHKPDPQPSPGLEARIVRRLVTPGTPAARRSWLWFLLPPAMALATVLLWPAPTAVPQAVPPVAVRQDPPTTAVVAEAPPLFASNPLERETLALQNDARRAGRFLIDCLPSFPVPIE